MYKKNANAQWWKHWCLGTGCGHGGLGNHPSDKAGAMCPAGDVSNWCNTGWYN